ncbi:unnamed protein product [Bursaphelenchus xylophilus]|uniref:(pine wood nematode) hypothetical protein n=1 Tax=Bursaphelenchus xylophilus TaxID=6326 RepID=A0A1I7SEZ2_BURXY|nr:unnamed protein product [Bursaphelenchus xylophilus]CAG9113680.1 unnamed protein product [Bursaphelenchus xylophilus]
MAPTAGLLAIFPLILLTTLCTADERISLGRRNDVSDVLRTRRSNFPCGKSFLPCDDENSILFDDPQSVETPNVEEQSVQFAAIRAKNEMDILYNRTEQALFNDFRGTNFLFSTYAWADLMNEDRYSKDLSYSALVSLKATANLKNFTSKLSTTDLTQGMPFFPVNNTIIHQICPINAIAECIPGKYRTYSGHCNNVDHPLWGAGYEPMQRLQAPSYADGVSTLRTSKNGRPLASPRLITKTLLIDNANATNPKPHKFCTLMLAQWSQFIFSDVAQVASTMLFKGEESLPLPCCATTHDECLPIIAGADDEQYKTRGQCLQYSRSFTAPRENCNLGPREQANLATSFLDASQLYGRTAEEVKKLREHSDGRLKSVKPSERFREIPPPAAKSSRSCAAPNDQPCFESANPWTNVLPTNAAMQTLFIRHHNTLARELHKRNSHWDDERTFQEARRILIAQVQHITYSEYLPIVVGKEKLKKKGLQLRRRSFDADYNMKTNPSLLNEYAAAVGHFYLSLLPDSIAQVTESGQNLNKQPLSNFFNNPSVIYHRDKVESLLRFMIREPIRAPGLHISREFTQKFLRGQEQFGLDYAALLIQMGRDHGLNSYTEWRNYCGLEKVERFEDLEGILYDNVDIELLKSVYLNVEDVDLFIGGLAEKPERGALIGPTFGCILSDQFEKIRHGDRFWYENFFQPSGFTEEQLMELRKTTLATIICENTDNLGLIQQSVFELPDEYTNCPMACNTTAAVKPNLDMWIDQEPKRRLPITKETLEKALRMGAEQYRRLKEAEKKRLQQQNRGASDRGSAVAAHASLMAPKKESLDRAEAAGILRATTNVLLRGDGLSENERLPHDLDVATLQELLPQVDVSRVIGNFSDFLGETPNAAKECLPKPLPCDHTAKYRTISGWCNNLRFPQYGNAFEPLRRLRDPAYDDGFDSPRTRAVSGKELPSARKISVTVHNDDERESVHFSHMLMQMGQIVDHDFTHSPITRGPFNSILNCSTCDSYNTLSIHCFPIKIDQGDPYFPATHNDGSPRCIPFARSLIGQVTLGYRNQLNQLTSFLDASHVYGSTQCEADHLRLFSQGMLNFTDLGFNKEALPQGTQERDCRSGPNRPCFVAGDERNNIQPGLATLHTIMMREHNRLAKELHRLNPHWTDEQLFQEARRIFTAKYNHIMYNEWLPIVIGCETMARYDLQPKKSGYYEGYDPTCDAAVSQEFSSAAFRFGHTLIRNVFPRMDGNYSETLGPGFQLREHFNNASTMYDKKIGHMESILMGLLGAPTMVNDRHIANAVRNHLFQRAGGPYTGLDLVAVNIQRARDHGVPGYNSYRDLCGVPKARSFNDLRDTHDESAIVDLRRVYEHVDDIDLFTGAMSEKPLKGAIIGPTIACLIAEQYQRAKRCDRFYYETNDPNLRFTPAQLAEIRKATMSKMICANSEYAEKIQPNAFLMPNDLTNAPIHCDEMLDTDLSEWVDRQFCVMDHRVIQLGKTKRVMPCISCTCTAEGTECHSITVDSCDALLKEFPIEEIRKDTVCMIQCSGAMKKRKSL